VVHGSLLEEAKAAKAVLIPSLNNLVVVSPTAKQLANSQNFYYDVKQFKKKKDVERASVHRMQPVKGKPGLAVLFFVCIPNETGTVHNLPLATAA